MTTELSFLVELLLNHKLAKATKDLIAERIQKVEANFSMGHLNQQVNKVPSQAMFAGSLINQTGVQQSASTMALMQKHANLAGMPIAEFSGDKPLPMVMAEPVPVANVAQTPMTAMAMNDRHAAISAAISGKPEKGRTSPRKF